MTTAHVPAPDAGTMPKTTSPCFVIGRVLALLLTPAAPLAAQVPNAASPNATALAPVLAQAGYAAMPFTWNGTHALVDVTIDTARATLILDSGFGGELQLAESYGRLAGMRTTDMKASTGTADGVQRGRWAFADRVALGSIPLGPLETYLLEIARDTTPLATPGDLDLVGAAFLNARGAIVDYVTDTLYLLAAAASPAPSPVPAGRTLHEVLASAGQYTTFLSLMQDAGLLALLDAPTRYAGTDSLAWRGFRLQAIQRSGAGNLPPSRERTLATRAGLDRLLRQKGRLTVFAPTDAAFARLGPATLRRLRADSAQLVRMLKGHMVANTYLDTLALRTLVRGIARPGGPTLGFHVMGQRIDVDRLTDGEKAMVVARATLVQPELTAGDAVAHGIDRVLMSDAASTPPRAMLATRDNVGIPMSRLPNGMYVVQAMVETIPMTLAVDTGSPYALALDTMRTGGRVSARAPRISFPSAPRWKAPVEAVPVDLGSVNTILASQDVPPIDGILGAELFVRYGARLDYFTGTLYLHKSPLPPR